MPGWKGAPDRILLIQLRHLGDVLLCTPAVRALRSAFPAAVIDFLSGRLGAEALAANPHLDRVLLWEPGVQPQRRLVGTLRGRRYNLVIDFQSNPRTAWLTRLSGAPRRLGVRRRGPRHLLYTDAVAAPDAAAYMARQRFALLEPLGISVGDSPELALELAVGNDERAFADEVWRREGLTGDAPVVAISAVSRDPHKQWGARRWADVADRLAEQGARILLTGGPGEREQVDAVAERMRHPAVRVDGKTTLRQLGAIYERCDVWTGNDGGAKHLAAAVGTPTVAVNRWRTGAVWTDAGPGSPHRYVEAAPPPGCGECEGCERCLGAVTPDDVVREVAEVLERRRAFPASPLACG
ncbi:lipopolysaccharide heptosyltransferase II [soil metagenome]